MARRIADVRAAKLPPLAGLGIDDVVAGRRDPKSFECNTIAAVRERFFVLGRDLPEQFWGRRPSDPM
jgi:hypothetical protein